MVRWKRAQLTTAKQGKMEELQSRKRLEARAVKRILARSRQCMEQTKRESQLEHKFRCLERRASKGRVVT